MADRIHSLGYYEEANAMKPFQGVDYYQTGELLSVDERNVRDAIRRWVEEQYVPNSEL